MNHQPHRTAGFRQMAKGLGLGLGLALLATALSSHAQGAQARPDPAAVAALQCLQRTVPAPRFDAAIPEGQDSGNGFLRVLLTFSGADQPPQVSVLASTGSPALREKAEAYLSGYRLPCHTAPLGNIQAQQEFHLDASGLHEGAPTHYLNPQGGAKPLCVVLPKEPLSEVMSSLTTRPVNVVVRVKFDGGPDDPPQVSLSSSDAAAALKDSIWHYVRSYRMPCRQPGDKTEILEQVVLFTPDGVQRRQFRQSPLPLSRFAAIVAKTEGKPAPFDLDTMACPFQVDWTSMQPLTANRVREIGTHNPNRSGFLAWLAAAHLNMSATAKDEMIGARVIIDVPCGVIDLRKDKPAT